MSKDLSCQLQFSSSLPVTENHFINAICFTFTVVIPATATLAAIMSSWLQFGGRSNPFELLRSIVLFVPPLHLSGPLLFQELHFWSAALHSKPRLFERAVLVALLSDSYLQSLNHTPTLSTYSPFVVI